MNRGAAARRCARVQCAKARANRVAVVLGLLGLLGVPGLTGLAQAAPVDPTDCGTHLAGPARLVAKATDGVSDAESTGGLVVFAPRPWPVPVGRLFALDIAVCPQAGTAMPASLRVDADMPAHRHGMNYRPTVTALGNGRFVAEGLMFHMPGRWRLQFQPAGAALATRDLTVE